MKTDYTRARFWANQMVKCFEKDKEIVKCLQQAIYYIWRKNFREHWDLVKSLDATRNK